MQSMEYAIRKVIDEIQHGKLQVPSEQELCQALSFLQQSRPEEMQAVLDLARLYGSFDSPPYKQAPERRRTACRYWNEFYVLDPQTLRFLHVNQTALNHLQQPIERLTKLTPLSIDPLYDRATLEEAIEPILAGRLRSIHFKTLHLRRDGSVYEVDINLQRSAVDQQPVLIARGKTSRFLALRRYLR